MTLTKFAIAAFLLAVGGLVVALWLRLDKGGLPGQEGPPTAADDSAKTTSDEGLLAISPSGSGPREVIPGLETFTSSGDSLAELQFLSLGGLEPVRGSRWRLERMTDGADKTRVTQAVTDAQGRISVPSGVWSLYSADQEWRPLISETDLQPKDRRVVWVQRIGNRQFVVTTPFDEPIEGVQAFWIPRSSMAGEKDVEGAGLLGVACLSDELGRIEFDSCPCDNGSVVFIHETFDREVLSLCGPPTENPVRVVMRASTNGRPLRFTTMDGVTPAMGVKLTSPAGYDVAHAQPNADLVSIPSWVPGDEPLWATSALTYPCILHLSRVRGDSVALPARRTSTVRVEDVTGCSGPILLFIRVLEEDPPAESEPATRHFPMSMNNRSETIVELPAGREVEIWATNSCGAFDRTEISADVINPHVVLSLLPTSNLSVRVSDAAGSALPSAQAHSSLFGKLQADAQGLIRVPLLDGIASFEVASFGYSPVVVSRNGVIPLGSGGDDLDLSLDDVVSAAFTVRSSEGRALPGMRVRVWPSTAVQFRSTSGAWIGNRVRSSVAGVTDSSGRFRTRAVREGPVEVEVDLPPQLGTDPYLRSVYGVVVAQLDLQEGGEYSLEAPRPFNLSLEVIAGSTGEPVRGFELRTDTSSVPSVAVSGGFWQGWVSSDLSSLQVVVPDLGSETIWLDPAAASVVLRVPVRSGSQVLVRVKGLPAPAQRSRLTFEVFRTLPGGLHLKRTFAARVNDDSEVSLDLEDAVNLRIGVADLLLGGQRLCFEPEFQAVGADGVVRFLCVKKEY